MPQWQGLKKSYKLYWEVYGGWESMLTSPYLMFAYVLSIGLAFFGKFCWYEETLSVLPNLLGFSLGAYALLVMFGEDEFRHIIAGRLNPNDTTPSPYLRASAMIFHAIFIQTAAIVYALFGKAWDVKTGSGLFQGTAAWFGTLLLIYAVLLILSMAMAILRISEAYDRFVGGTRGLPRKMKLKRRKHTRRKDSKRMSGTRL